MSRRNRNSKSEDNQESTMTEVIQEEIVVQPEPTVEDQVDPIEEIQNNDEEVDMGEVEEEKELTPFAKEFLKRGDSKIHQTKGSKSNSANKVPIFGKRPKRGFPFGALYINDKSVGYTPHHQKQLIIELLEFFKPGITMKELVETIEANENYWKRLLSNQAVYDCVHYHTKQLLESGYLSVTAPQQGQEES